MKNKINKTKNKKGIELDMLGWIIIAVVVLIIAVVFIILMKGKMTGALKYITDVFRFRK